MLFLDIARVLRPPLQIYLLASSMLPGTLALLNAAQRLPVATQWLLAAAQRLPVATVLLWYDNNGIEVLRRQDS